MGFSPQQRRQRFLADSFTGPLPLADEFAPYYPEAVTTLNVLVARSRQTGPAGGCSRGKTPHRKWVVQLLAERKLGSS